MLNINTITDNSRDIAVKYGVASMDLFGSYADGTASETSDLDFLVKFNTEVPSIFKVMGFREELQRRFGVPVDVVTLPLPNPEKLRVNRVVNIL